jgi:hypothetical protein
MSSQAEPLERKVQKGFEKALNSHGYGFQYAVLKAASELYHQNRSNWVFQVAEFPVEVQKSGTRVDFMLARTERNLVFNRRPFVMLAECKRANPALSNWCFVRAPYTSNHGFANCLIMEETQLFHSSELLSSAKVIPMSNDLFFHIGLEVRSGEKGDGGGSRRNAIEDAATQILRGLNGFVDLLKVNPQLLGEKQGGNLLPVVFTTAQIWTSDVDLSTANLTKGNIDLAKAGFTTQPYVFYQYNSSPGLKHSASPGDRSGGLGEIMESEFVRTIPIVNANGIEKFLTWSSNLQVW